ncbi:hypothetical protein BC332_12276 [Capsicum chinense]|nr:hypothetical protein BC332_12276 [Capsicum chinense]
MKLNISPNFRRSMYYYRKGKVIHMVSNRLTGYLVLKERCIRVYDSLKCHRGHADEIKELGEMLSTYLTISDFLKKKSAQTAYAEFLSDRHQIPSSEFDPKKHHTRYTSLLWDNGVNRACTGYISDNQDLPRPKRISIQFEDTEMIDVEP